MNRCKNNNEKKINKFFYSWFPIKMTFTKSEFTFEITDPV